MSCGRAPLGGANEAVAPGLDHGLAVVAADADDRQRPNTIRRRQEAMAPWLPGPVRAADFSADEEDSQVSLMTMVPGARPRGRGYILAERLADQRREDARRPGGGSRGQGAEAVTPNPRTLVRGDWVVGRPLSTRQTVLGDKLEVTQAHVDAQEYADQVLRKLADFFPLDRMPHDMTPRVVYVNSEARLRAVWFQLDHEVKLWGCAAVNLFCTFYAKKPAILTLGTWTGLVVALDLREMLKDRSLDALFSNLPPCVQSVLKAENIIKISDGVARLAAILPMVPFIDTKLVMMLLRRRNLLLGLRDPGEDLVGAGHASFMLHGRYYKAFRSPADLDACHGLYGVRDEYPLDYFPKHRMEKNMLEWKAPLTKHQESYVFYDANAAVGILHATFALQMCRADLYPGATEGGVAFTRRFLSAWSGNQLAGTGWDTILYAKKRLALTFCREVQAAELLRLAREPRGEARDFRDGLNELRYADPLMRGAGELLRPCLTPLRDHADYQVVEVFRFHGPLSKSWVMTPTLDGCSCCGEDNHESQACPILWGQVELHTHCDPRAWRLRLCSYPACTPGVSHLVAVCPTLHRRCQACYNRGHARKHCNLRTLAQHKQLFDDFACRGVGTGLRLENPMWGFADKLPEEVLRAVVIVPKAGGVPKIGLRQPGIEKSLAEMYAEAEETE